MRPLEDLKLKWCRRSSAIALEKIKAQFNWEDTEQDQLAK